MQSMTEKGVSQKVHFKFLTEYKELAGLTRFVHGVQSMTKKGVSQKGAKIVGTGSNPSTANASRQNQEDRSQNKAASSTSRNERQVVEDIMGETLTPESDPSQVRQTTQDMAPVTIAYD